LIGKYFVLQFWFTLIGHSLRDAEFTFSSIRAGVFIGGDLRESLEMLLLTVSMNF
jgi:hypothetical protein